MNASWRRTRHGLLARSFAIQATWNYQTLIGTGFAFLLSPALRRIYAGNPEGLREALARHSELFNSHPYLVSIAAGAVIRLEHDGTPPETIRRFKNAVRGSLGSMGDRLIWQSWRPACALLGVCALLTGAPWWAGVALFLVPYNALHLWLRGWGLRIGFRHGLGVGRALQQAPLERLGERAADAGAALAGFAAVAAIGYVLRGDVETAFGGVGILAGLWAGLRLRRTAWIGFLLLWIADLIVITTF